MDDHRRKILEMLEKGTITAEDASRLMEKLDSSSSAEGDVEGAKPGASKKDAKGAANGIGEKLSGLMAKLQGVAEAAREAVDEAGSENCCEDQTGFSGTTADASGKNANAQAYGAGVSYAESGQAGKGIPGKAGSINGRVVSNSVSISASELETETRSLRMDSRTGTAFQIHTTNGSVRVESGSASEVQVEAIIKAETKERLKAVKIILEQEGEGLHLRVEWPGQEPGPSEGCAFLVKSPKVDGLTVHTSNGSINVSDMGGATQLNTCNASISASDHEGSVDAKTTNGSITMEDVAGENNASADNGRVRITGAGGSVNVCTSNRAADVELSDSNAGPVCVKSNNGKVCLVLGDAFEGELNLSTSNNKIKFDAPEHVRVLEESKSKVSLAVGESDQKSSVSTSNAKIVVSFD